MPNSNMRGVTEVREIVMSYLETNMPILLAQARIDWEENTDTLPNPLRYLRYEPLSLSEGQYPTIAVNVINASGFKRRLYTEALEEEYLVSYVVRVFAWVKTPTIADETAIEPQFSSAIKLRDDLGTIIRKALLLSTSLGNEKARWEENTLTEEYSDVEPIKGNRYVCGVILNFDIEIDERLDRIILGTADTIRITEVDILPMQEA